MLGQCIPCGKLAYRDRKTARAHARKVHPGESLNAYPCPRGRGWHFGHLRPGDRDR